MVSERTGQYQKNSINWIPITPISETEILPGMDLSKECPEVLGVISNKNLVLNKEFENEFFDSLAECNSYFNGGADYRLLFPEYLKKTYNEKKYISTFDMCNLKASHENNWTPLFSFFKQKIIVVPFKMEDLLNPLRGSLYENFYIIFKYSEENMFKIANAFYNPIFKDDENYTKENMKHLLYVYSNKRPKKFKDYENNFIYE
jgi:hypothetical protein